jgi:hypothetical protein
MKLEVVLGASQEASFTITLNDNSFTHKWVEELRWCINNSSFNQLESFCQQLTLDESCKILIDACQVINSYLKDYIEIRKDIANQPQEYFNYLHRKFEDMSGSWGERTRLFSIAPQELKNSIRNLNLFVHRIESKQTRSLGFDIKFDKDQFRRQPFDQSDYKYFDFNIPRGTLFLHYAEIGKEFIDLYEDNLPVDYGAFTNQHHYSGEASFLFVDYNMFEDTGYLQWLVDNGIDPYNKTLGHGRLILGQVDDLEDAKIKIETYKHIYTILIKE